LVEADAGYTCLLWVRARVGTLAWDADLEVLEGEANAYGVRALLADGALVRHRPGWRRVFLSSGDGGDNDNDTSLYYYVTGLGRPWHALDRLLHHRRASADDDDDGYTEMQRQGQATLLGMVLAQGWLDAALDWQLAVAEAAVGSAFYLVVGPLLRAKCEKRDDGTVYVVEWNTLMDATIAEEARDTGIASDEDKKKKNLADGDGGDDDGPYLAENDMLMMVLRHWRDLAHATGTRVVLATGDTNIYPRLRSSGSDVADVIATILWPMPGDLLEFGKNEEEEEEEEEEDDEPASSPEEHALRDRVRFALAAAEDAGWPLPAKLPATVARLARASYFADKNRWPGHPLLAGAADAVPYAGLWDAVFLLASSGMDGAGRTRVASAAGLGTGLVIGPGRTRGQVRVYGHVAPAGVHQGQQWLRSLIAAEASAMRHVLRLAAATAAPLRIVLAADEDAARLGPLLDTDEDWLTADEDKEDEGLWRVLPMS
jgi:hypothetical protein